MKLPLEGEYYTSPSTGMKFRIDKALGEKMRKPLFPEQITRAKKFLEKADLTLLENHRKKK